MTTPSIVIGVSAEIRGGKGICVKILETIFEGQTSVVSSGMILKDLARAFQMPNPTARETLQEAYSRAKSVFGEKCLHYGILDRWQKSGKGVWVFDGVLMPWDVEFVKSFPSSILFFVDCTMEERFRRAKLAALKGEPDSKSDEAEATWEDFRRRHEHETAKFVASIKNLAGVAVLDNNGTPRELGSQIVAILLNRLHLDQQKIFARKEALENLYREIESR